MAPPPVKPITNRTQKRQYVFDRRFPLFCEEWELIASRVTKENGGDINLERSETIDKIAIEAGIDISDLLAISPVGCDDADPWDRPNELKQWARDLLRAHLNDARDFKDELSEMSDNAFGVLYNQERKRHIREVREIQALEDKVAFFNDNEFTADYEFWGRYEVWTVDEAVALSLGKDPRTLNTTVINAWYHRSRSLFCNEYKNRTDQIERSIQAGSLRSPIIPRLFGEWAERNSLSLPKEILYHDGPVRATEMENKITKSDRSTTMRLETALDVLGALLAINNSSHNDLNLKITKSNQIVKAIQAKLGKQFNISRDEVTICDRLNDAKSQIRDKIIQRQG